MARLEGMKGSSCTDGQEYRQTSTKPSHDRPRVSYYETPNAPDPCSDPSLLEPIDAHQHEDISKAIERMLERAAMSELPEALQPRLRKLVHYHMDIFRVGLSCGTPVLIPPLHIAIR